MSAVRTRSRYREDMKTDDISYSQPHKTRTALITVLFLVVTVAIVVVVLWHKGILFAPGVPTPPTHTADTPTTWTHTTWTHTTGTHTTGTHTAGTHTDPPTDSEEEYWPDNRTLCRRSDYTYHRYHIGLLENEQEGYESW